MTTKILFTLLFFIKVATVNAQLRQVTGQLKSTSGETIANASVLLKNNSGLIISFYSSNDNGKYVLTLPDTSQLTSLLIEVNHLGYKKMQQSLTEGKTVYDFVMEKKVMELPEVQVKSRPVIEHNGDTLSYNVASFSRPEDRTVGDVIKRMPGLDVGENGQIFYNGEAIANLYMHGDDLLDGRYSLAPRTISKDLIKSVEVIRNHQPIKALKNKVHSDNVVINLVLKDENSIKLSGQAMLGGGLPHQYDAALNTMMFNKKFKMLNALKANNSGIDYTDDFAQFGATSFLNDIGNTRPNTLLSAGTAGKPDIPRRNYYLNNSAVINANNLVKTKNELQLRSNIQGFIDRNTLNYSSRVDNYLETDTIHYSELQNAVNNPFLLNIALSAITNKDRYYISNSLRFNTSGDNKNSYMDFNHNAFNQRLRERTYDLSNNFSWIPAFGNKSVMEIQWYINYYKNPQRLYVGAGLNNDILNHGLPYEAITQQAGTPTLFSNATIGYRITNTLISQDYKIGVLNEWQQLNSTLQLTQSNGSVTNYTGDAGNALHWRRDRAYLNASFGLRKKSWEAGLSVPLFWQFIRYYQDVYSLDKKQQQFFINPSFNFKLYINAEDYLSLNYRYNNNVGNIAGVYRGAVLTNYRSLFANNAELQEQNTSGIGFRYNFQRSVIMLFANAGINYNRVKANSILSSELTNNVQRTILLPYENDQSTLGINAGISKYLFALKATVSLKSALTRAHYNQFINNEKLPFINDMLTLSASIDNKLFRVISFNYNGSGIWRNSRQQSKTNEIRNTMQRFDQNISLGYSPAKNLFLTTKANHMYSSQANVSDISYFFMDANVRYKYVKWRMDLELDVTNIANVKRYEVFRLTSNLFAVNSYDIRGRMLIARATFNL